MNLEIFPLPLVVIMFPPPTFTLPPFVDVPGNDKSLALLPFIVNEIIIRCMSVTSLQV